MIFLTTYTILKNDWITIVFVLLFLLLAIAKLLYKNRLLKLINIFFSKNYFLSYGKEKRLIASGFNTLLFLVQSATIALLFFAYIAFYKSEMIIDTGLFLFLKIIVLVISFFFFRYFIGALLGVLFEVNKPQRQLAFAKMSYLFSSVVLLLPFLLFVFYIKIYNLLFFQLTIAVLTILLIVRYVVLFQNNKNRLLRQLFYFILYICALEIAPLLLIYKMVA